MEKELSILIIDDDEVDRMILKRALKTLQYKCTIVECDDASSGIKELTEGNYDCVFLDYLLPGTDGLSILKTIKTNKINTPIVMVTSHGDEQKAVEIMKAGASDYLVKGQINEFIITQTLINVIRIREAEQKQELTEQHLREEQQKYRQLVENASDIIYRTNYNGNFIYVNPIALKITGFTEKELLGKHFLELIYPDDRKAAEEFYLKQFKLYDTETYYEFRMVSSTGKLIHIGQNVSMIREGELINGFQAVARDITEKKAMENSIKANEARFRAMADASPLGIFVTDIKGDCTYINKMYEEITGLTFEQVLEEGFDAAIHPEDKEYVIKSWHETVKAHKPFASIHRYLKNDKSVLWTSVKAGVIKNGEDVLGYVGVIEDTTQRIQTEKELIKAKEIAEESVKVKEQFLANMSHEIRTPMHGIIGLTRFLLEDKCTPEQRENLNAIKVSADNLLVIINDILDISKIEADKMTFESVDFSLHNSIATIGKLLGSKAIEKNIQLTVDIDKNVPQFIKGDSTRLNQIIINLLGNALKFTEQGEIKLEVVTKQETETSVNLQFAIEDTGIGIPQEKIVSIFESFTQATGDTSRKYGGTGLGLTIVKKLVELQNGKISVISEVGKGSVFYINLDFLKAESVVPQKQMDKSSSMKLDSKLRILVAEDNAINQMLIRKLIKKWGIEIDIAENGRVAVEKVSENFYDIVLMDVQMPEMDGYEAALQVKNICKKYKRDIPILAMTAHATSDEYEKCLQSGMDDYISKPFEEEVLYNKIIKLMGLDQAGAAPDIKSVSVIQYPLDERVNFDYLNTIFNGDTQVIREILEVFVKQMPGMVIELNEQYKNNEWKLLRDIIHKLKSNMSITGVKILQEYVATLESLAKSEVKEEKFSELIDRFTSIMTHVIEQFEIEIQGKVNTKLSA